MGNTANIDTSIRQWRKPTLETNKQTDAPSENFPPQCGEPAAFSSPAQQHKSYQLLIRLNLLEINAVLLSHCRFLVPGNTQKNSYRDLTPVLREK